ncbi:MAG: SUMF1/EgtB/PvdO family nonheme iron enzyme, partial [Phycisphaerales bacterium]
SGIVVGRGDDVRFWHLTFQEYLAARAIAARSDQEQNEILLTPAGEARLYLPDWREAVLLLGGVLHKQGHRKVDSFISAVLDKAEAAGMPAAEARCAGLLGAMVRDLSAANYRPGDVRYEELLDRVMSIFDPKRSVAIDIKDIIAAAEALGQAGDPRFAEDALKDNWVDIPAGRFLMGAQAKDPSKPNYDGEAYDDESPVHEVRLDGFRIGRYPVTVGEYLRFVEAGGYGDRELWEAGGFGEWTSPEDWDEQFAHLNRPVVGVSWFEAAAYARWRGCRLPTEAEWERAARGPEGRSYPWGDSAPDALLANYDGAKVGAPTPVGIYPRGATAEGLMDMAGNVWEWCSDWFGDYSKAAAENPRGHASGTYRCLRGGSWLFDDHYLRCSFRSVLNPDGRDDVFGFRVVFSQS